MEKTYTMKFLIELFVFLKVRKKWWLIPIVIFSLIFGTVIIISEGSSIAPLIYTLFVILHKIIVTSWFFINDAHITKLKTILV